MKTALRRSRQSGPQNQKNGSTPLIEANSKPYMDLPAFRIFAHPSGNDPYRFTSAALTELRKAILYYEQRENGLGTAFLDEIEATLNRILQHPTAWHRLSSRTRRCRTHRFPFHFSGRRFVMKSPMRLAAGGSKFANTAIT